jgi:hypothetical protein
MARTRFAHHRLSSGPLAAAHPLGWRSAGTQGSAGSKGKEQVVERV